MSVVPVETSTAGTTTELYNARTGRNLIGNRRIAPRRAETTTESASRSSVVPVETSTAGTTLGGSREAEPNAKKSIRQEKSTRDQGPEKRQSRKRRIKRGKAARAPESAQEARTRQKPGKPLGEPKQTPPEGVEGALAGDGHAQRSPKNPREHTSSSVGIRRQRLPPVHRPEQPKAGRCEKRSD